MSEEVKVTLSVPLTDGKGTVRAIRQNWQDNDLIDKCPSPEVSADVKEWIKLALYKIYKSDSNTEDEKTLQSFAVAVRADERKNTGRR